MPEQATIDWNTVKFGFRCKSCGHLHLAAHAGEFALPHACSVCGKGIHFEGSGINDPAKSDAGAKAAHPELGEAGVTLSDAAPHGRRFRVGPFFKYAIHSNWEVLADCTPERLAEIGLTPDRVERHTPLPAAPAQRSPTIHNIGVDDKAVLQDQSSGTK